MTATQRKFPIGAEILPAESMPTEVRADVIDSICVVTGYGPWEGTINVIPDQNRKRECTWAAESWQPLEDENQ